MSTDLTKRRPGNSAVPAVAAVEDRLRASLTSDVASLVTIRSHSVFPTVDGRLQSRELVSFEPAESCPDEHHEELLATLEEFETACEPSDPRAVFAHVSRLYKTTRRRLEEADEDELAFLLWGYVDDLREFPLDIVAEVCNERRRSSEWWPMPAVLVKACEERVAKRRGMRDALRKLAEREGLRENVMSSFAASIKRVPES